MRFDDILRHWSSPGIISFYRAGTHYLFPPFDLMHCYSQLSPTASLYFTILSTHTSIHCFPYPHRFHLSFSQHRYLRHTHQTRRKPHTQPSSLSHLHWIAEAGVCNPHTAKTCDGVAHCCLLPVFLSCCFLFCFGLFKRAFCTNDTI